MLLWLLIIWSPVEVVVWLLGKRGRPGVWQVRVGAALVLFAFLTYELASMVFTGVEGYDDRTFDAGPWQVACGAIGAGGIVLALAGVWRCLRVEAPVASGSTT